METVCINNNEITERIKEMQFYALTFHNFINSNLDNISQLINIFSLDERFSSVVYDAQTNQIILKIKKSVIKKDPEFNNSEIYYNKIINEKIKTYILQQNHMIDIPDIFIFSLYKLYIYGDLYIGITI